MLIRFISIYAVVSVLFTVLSWGHPEPARRLPDATPDLALHLLIHVAFGVIAALPSGRLSLIVASGIAVLVIDVDHIAWGSGVPTASHASHSIGFALLIGFTTWALARQGFFQGVPPVLLAAVAVASVPAHIAADAVASGRVPLFAPVTFTRVDLAPLSGVLFLLGGVVLVWAAVARFRKGPETGPLLRDQ